MFPKTRDGGGVPDSRGCSCTIDVPTSQSNYRSLPAKKSINNFVDVNFVYICNTSLVVINKTCLVGTKARQQLPNPV